MSITRKDFCGGLAGGSVLLLLQACGGGGSSGGGGTIAACGASGAAIAGNHGHVLTIAKADLDSLTDKTYSIAGSAGHDHSVTLTVAQLQQLKAGMGVIVTSTMTNAHSHAVTSSCP